MTELDKLKKENKRLKSLLKNAVQLLNTYKGFLKDPEAIGIGKTAAKKVPSTQTRKKAPKPK